jgi:hypothetical protein
MITIAGLLVLLVIVFVKEMIEALAGVIAAVVTVFVTIFVVIPFKLTQFVLRRRYIPATQRNLTRASGGIFTLVLVVLTARWLPYDPATEALALGFGAVSLLYICIGYVKSRGAPCDPMAVIWWSAGALICTAALIFVPGATPADPRLLESLAYAGIAACVLRVWLLLRPVPGATLPHPSKIPGMPMAGPASTGSAHAALGRRGRGARPKFKV